MMKSYLFLALAIAFELLATSMLKASEQFSRPIPAVVTVVAYVACFYFLGLSFRTIPVGLAYGIWAGAGIVLIMLIGILFFRQMPDLPAVLGVLLIVAGVVIIHLFSKMNVH